MRRAFDNNIILRSDKNIFLKRPREIQNKNKCTRQSDYISSSGYNHLDYEDIILKNNIIDGHNWWT